ncbi:MAG: SWIM zinc finger family protein [Bacteroidota bacterium]
MNFPIKQFEQFIDETILKRGLTYFKQGAVCTVDEITQGHYEAIVEGTEDYIVQIALSNGNINEHSCTCHYDLGPVCKHITAVLFYLQQDELDIHSKKQKEKIAGAKGSRLAQPQKRKKTISDQVKDLLGEIPHQELVEFIQKKTEDNRDFRDIFLASFAHYNREESQESYNKQIESILKQAAGRDGYIDWSRTFQVGNMVSGLVTTARNQLLRKNYRSAIFQCCAVMEEMTDAFQFADDSHGDIGGCIEEAIEVLNEIASDKSLPEVVRKQLFNYCLNAYQKGRFSGWDWHTGVLSLASEITRTEEDANKIMALLDKDHPDEYDKEQAQTIKLKILIKIKGEKEADAFMEQNLSNPSLRRAAMEKALSKNDFEKVIRIAQEGITHDKKNKPGLAMEWYDWLLRVAIEQKDKRRIVEYARILFVHSIREKKDYYQLMKANTVSDKWNQFVEELIRDVEKNSRFGDFHLIAEIYISEQWLDRLLNWVSKGPLTLEGVSGYEKYLSKDYAKELTEIYEKKIIEYLQNSTGRHHYQNACRYMRKMVKLGAKDAVSRMIAQFRKEYAQRRALMEELGRV